MSDFDVVIAGGGLAGSTLACALANSGARIAIVESVEASADHQPSFDDRAIALAYGSQRIFEGIGLWDSIAPSATAIRKIHVSERGGFGFTHLDAAEEQVPALGYVALARELGGAILQQLENSSVTRISPATVMSFTQTEGRLGVDVEADGRQQQLTARLLVAADGGQSLIRQQLDIKTRQWEYGQTAIVTNVTPGIPHHNIAYERFTPNGPLALLPMTENRFGVVLTISSEACDEVMALDNDAFVALLQQRIGFRCGRFSRIGKRFSYPLTLMTANEVVRPRIALVGNAGHALHPISGQGFNLGLRDIAVLADLIANALRQQQDPGSEQLLQQYQKQRLPDQQQVALLTDGLVRLFGNPLRGLSMGRNLGMLAADLLPGVRHRIARHAMGLGGIQSRLARGLPTLSSE
ncbi:MAG: 2-octaprenyl-6-methoxyphenyl hydroxylase [Gammaproteobacteria bacterium]|nr:2-octaprenyl-6-methoxyphenyl hydroxylase [Gammaproteobacteria bacterium]